MKRIKSLCIALVLALLVTYVPVSAAVQDDTMIKMQQKDTSQVELALYPNGDMIKNHSTTFRIQMRITEAESGSIGEIHFAFSEEIQNRCKIREYFYENGILDIYFSSAGTVFEQAQDVVIGTISGTPSGEMFRASIAPESIMFVDQSHQMKQVDEGVLQGISYQWAVGEKVPDPDNPNPDNPNPDNPNPDNRTRIIQIRIIQIRTTRTQMIQTQTSQIRTRTQSIRMGYVQPPLTKNWKRGWQILV